MNVSIRLAKEEEAFIVHQVMIAAFEEYRQTDVRSSALNETVDSIRQKLRSGTEQALLCFNSNQPIGTVRFTINGASLYFFRLSVCPKARGKGVAKASLARRLCKRVQSTRDQLQSSGVYTEKHLFV